MVKMRFILCKINPFLNVLISIEINSLQIIIHLLYFLSFLKIMIAGEPNKDNCSSIPVALRYILMFIDIYREDTNK